MIIMKKSILLTLAIVLPLLASAQAKVKTKQYILADFPEKTLKVVLTENEMFNEALKVDIEETWHISPYEFCNKEEFEKIKKSEEYYFLALTDTKVGKASEPSYRSLTIFKGREQAADGYNGLYKVVSLPFCDAKKMDGRENAILPAMVSVLQNEILNIMKRPINLGSGVVVTPSIIKGKWGRKILVDKDDLSFEMGFSLESTYKQENIHMVESEEIAKAIAERTEGTMVCYCILPAKSARTGICYVMLFDAESYDLVYMKSHNIDSKTPRGILQSEMRYFINCN